jgi:4-hydroxy-tetrahydrodipicolinate reductase
MPINVALFGAAGRMGRAILIEAQTADDIKIVHAYERSGHPLIDQRIDGVHIEATPKEIGKDTQVIVDFSTAEAALRHVQMAASARVPCVVGVTGIAKQGHAELQQHAKAIPILWAPNMSPGMTMLFELAPLLAKALPDYDRHIIETHHTQKKDAPSGSALMLQSALSETGETPITSLRLGDIAGEHRLILAGPGESVEIAHHAQSRRAFALGTLRAIRWIISKEPGLYGMNNVLAP